MNRHVRGKDTTRVLDELTVEAPEGAMKDRSARGIIMPGGGPPSVEHIEKTFGVSRERAEQIARRYE